MYWYWTRHTRNGAVEPSKGAPICSASSGLLGTELLIRKYWKTVSSICCTLRALPVPQKASRALPPPLWMSLTFILGVRLSHQMMVAYIYMTSQVAREWAYPRILSGELEPTELRTLAHLPAAHIAGVAGYFVGPVYAGASCYWMKKYTWKDFLRYNKEHRITSFFVSPPIHIHNVEKKLSFRWNSSPSSSRL